MDLIQAAIWGALGGYCLEAVKLYEMSARMSSGRFEAHMRSLRYWGFVIALVIVSAILAAAARAQFGAAPFIELAIGISARSTVRELSKAAIVRAGPPQGGPDEVTLRSILT